MAHVSIARVPTSSCASVPHNSVQNTALPFPTPSRMNVRLPTSLLPRISTMPLRRSKYKHLKYIPSTLSENVTRAYKYSEAHAHEEHIHTRLRSKSPKKISFYRVN